MNLAHFSSNPNLTLETLRPFDLSKGGAGPKPLGLWITDMDCEYNWKQWCEDNNFRLDSLEFEYSIEIETCKILIISEWNQLFDFSEEYKNYSTDFYLQNWEINWPSIYRKYSGILISPYFWQCRMEENFKWYYGWDCASGAIWDKSAITHLARKRTTNL